MAGQSYRDLLVWQKSMQLVTEIYRLTDGFPKVEQFGLCAQLRRAVVSIPSNIAEGQGRNSPKEFVYHLSVAYGSLMEAETQIQIAANLSYVSQVEADKLIAQAAEVGRMLNGLSRSLAQNKELKTAN
jgi:four helix bundle protein